MNAGGLVSIVGCLTAVLPAMVQESISPTPEIREWVRRAAFDPTTYFQSARAIDRSSVRISHDGGGNASPGYAIAIARGCVDAETSGDCASQLRARMVRAPMRLAPAYPGGGGSGLFKWIGEAGVRGEEDVKRVLGEVDLEWVEADLRGCPGAVHVLTQSADAEWVPLSVTQTTPGEGWGVIVTHAENVSVEIQDFTSLTSYRGAALERNPAAWAVRMAEVLEPCWKVGSAPAPWTR